MPSSLVRRALLAVAAVASIALLLVGAAHLPSVRARVFQWTRAQVADRFGIVLNADAIEYNLLTASVELRNPTLAVSGERGFLEADSVRIVLDRSALWGTIRLRRLDLARPRVAIVRHRDGTTNLPAGSTGPSSRAAPLPLGLVTIRGLSLQIEDEAGGPSAVAGPIDLTLDARSTDSRSGAFGPSAFAVRFAAQEVSSLSGTLAGRLAFDGARLAVPELRIETPEGQLALDGWIDILAETSSVEARGRLELDLARAGRLVGGASSGPLTGSAAADVVVNGSITNPSVHIGVSGRDLRYRSVTGTSLSAEATYTAGRLVIDRLDATSSLGRAQASGALILASPGPPAGTSRMHTQLMGVDVDRVLAAAGTPLPVPVGSSAAGELDVALSVEGTNPFAPGWLDQLTADASVRLVPAGPGLSVGGRVRFHLRAGQWTIEHAVQSTAARLTATGTLSGQIRQGQDLAIDSTMSGESRVRFDELSAVVPLLRKAGVEMPAAIDDNNNNISGSIDARVEPRGTLRSPSILATVNGRAIRSADFPEGELDSTLTIDRRAVRAQTLDLRSGGARLIGSGEYRWSGQIDTRFEVTAGDLDAVARAFGVAAGVPLAGSARLEGSLQGDARSPHGRATLTMHDLSVDDVSIGDLTATFGLAGEQLAVDLRAPGIDARLEGEIDTREPFRYRAEVALDRTAIRTLLPPSLHSPVLMDGTITGTARAQGTLRRPFESTGEVALRALDVNVSGVPVVLEAPATISIGLGAITATPVELRVGKQTHARLAGTLALDEIREGWALRIDADVSDLVELAGPLLSGWPVGADAARVDIDVRVGGTLRAPEPAGTLALRASALRYADQPPLADVAIDARISPTEIALQSLTATWQGARIAAEGAVPLRLIVPGPRPGGAIGVAALGSNWLASLPREPRAATLVARVTGVTPGVLVPYVEPAQLSQIAGTVSATVTAEADAFAVDQARASVVLDEGLLTLAGVTFTQAVPTRLRFENGSARIEELRWDTGGNEVRVSGGAALTGPGPTVDLVVDGAVDLRILSAFVDGVATGGVARPTLTVKGPLRAPDFVGTIGVTAGEIRIDTPEVAASNIDGTITIAADRLATLSLKGLVNGGPAEVTGNVTLKDLAAPVGRVGLTARNVALEYPAGFQTESNADLALTLAPTRSTLTGRVDVLTGIYREPLVISRGLLAGFGESEVVTTSTESSWLASLGLDVSIATADELRIDNNYGRLSFVASLGVTGTADRPGAIGRIEAMPDGEIYLAGNTYRVQRLIVDLANPRTIAPDVSFLAETRIGNVPIEVALACAAAACERDVRSQAVTNEEAEALLFGISSDPAAAGAQLARLLSGELLGIVGHTVGLDTLRLEQGAGDRANLFDDPTLVASDVNPASRLTVGKRLGTRAELAYSQDLARNGFTTSMSYFAPGGISLRALLLDDQSRTFEFRHEPRLGGPRRERPPRALGARIAAVRISGNPGIAESELRGQLRLAEGGRFAFATWQDDRERLNALYRSRGFFEARVRARRLSATPDTGLGARDLGFGTGAEAPDAVVLEYTIERGRSTRLDVSGFSLPDTVRRRIVERWSSAIFDGFLERDVHRIVREHLYLEGRLHAKVAASVRADEAVKTLAVEIDPGPATTPRLQFEGNSIVSTSRLLSRLGVAEVARPIVAWLDPSSFALVIERIYRQEGLLSAAVDVLAPELQDHASVVRVVIREGEAFQIGRVTVGGADVLGESGSPDSLELPAGSRYDPAGVAERISGLEQRFRNAGFLDVRVVAETVVHREEHRADVHVLVEPGPRSLLESVSVEGGRLESPLVAPRLNLAIGMPVNSSAVADTRRRLYETGVYQSVEIDLEPVDAEAPPGVFSAGDRRVVARIRVQERPRYNIRYGLSVNDDVGSDGRDRRIGFAADLENRNILGLGATGGVSARLRRDQQVGRLFAGANRFFGLPLTSSVFLSRGRKEIGSAGASRTVADVTEISAEQRYRLLRFVDVRYGYGLGRNRTTIEGADFDLTVRVARLTTSGVVDRRNDPFDPARGWFTSASFELSRPGLGSDLSFLSSFLQFFQFRPLPHGVVLASAARLGLARTFRDETLIQSERFFGGGATSVRGYFEDDLGPRSIFGDADGGPALLIVNGELRFRVHGWLRGVGFLDLGNVYRTAGDVALSSLRVGAGAGVRVDTPIGLLRLDAGVPINPRVFDPKWRLHFGLGHAF